MTPRWPLPVASHLLFPAGPAASDDGGCIHLCDLASTAAGCDAAITDHTIDITASATVAASRDGRAGSPAASLCGGAAMVMAVHPDLDLLGGDHQRLCGSCWRIVERWLTPPPPAPGEDLVVAWLVETVLRGGRGEDISSGHRLRRTRLDSLMNTLERHSSTSRWASSTQQRRTQYQGDREDREHLPRNVGGALRTITPAMHSISRAPA